MKHLIRFSSLLGILGCVFLLGCGSGPVAAPTSYSLYNSKAGTFEIEYPDGWTATGGGGRGPEWARFETGPVFIRVSADVAGSLMGDIARSAGGSDFEAMRPEDAPVHSVHLTGIKKAEEDYKGYTEIGNPAELDVRLGPARVSEFTASTTFGGGLHGYRATILAHDKRVTVFCVCPESDWTTLKPAFDQCLKTLKRGQSEL
jgi:hypothetical protein